MNVLAHRWDEIICERNQFIFFRLHNSEYIVPLKSYIYSILSECVRDAEDKTQVAVWLIYLIQGQIL